MGAPFSVGISITSSVVAAAPAAPISRFATLADVAKHAASIHVAALGDLSDVDTAGVVDADVLSFNVLTGLWEPAPAGAGAIALDDLTDVDVAGALDGKILRKVAGVWQDDDETPVSLGLDDLTDVDVAGALDGTILKKVAGVWQDAAEPGFPALDDLTDVDVAGAPDGKVLKKVGGIWQDADDAGATALNDLSDVDTTGLADNHILRYDLTSALWKPEAVPVPALDDLTDVNTAGLADNDVLQFNLASGQWEPDPLPGPPALDDLTDVDVAGAVDGKILKKVSGVWQDADESGGGGTSWATEPGLKPPGTPHASDLEFEEANGTDPTTLGLVWVNQGTSTATIRSGKLVVTAQPATGFNLRILQASVPSSPFTVTTRAAISGAFVVLSSAAFGFRNTATGKALAVKLILGSAEVKLEVIRSNSPTSYASTPLVNVKMRTLGPIYQQLEDDGTNLIIRLSPDGLAFVTIYSETRAAFVGTPDRVFAGVGQEHTGAASSAMFDFLRFNWTADYDPTV